MTRFIDGPAIGQTLMLKRAPVYLRVVQDVKGKFDALDQPEDTPHPDEQIWAYVLKEKPGMAFVDGRNIHDCYVIASYQFVICQPPRTILIDTDRWRLWCECLGMPDHLEKA